MAENERRLETDTSPTNVPNERVLYKDASREVAEYRATRGSFKDNVLAPATIGATLGLIVGIPVAGAVAIGYPGAGAPFYIYIVGAITAIGATWGILQNSN